ncbi:MAG: hypothetical protein NT003_01000 [Candidatus Magasanikbacteria bacterium]|nr:hypothetical protein [Candidatus Magasanikbacteria bacterium]
MFNNPFDKKIARPEDTDPKQNRDLIDTLLGSDVAAEFENLTKNSFGVQKDRGVTIAARAKEAVAAHDALLKKIEEAKAEHFFSVELGEQFDEQIEMLFELGLLQGKEGGEYWISAVDKKSYTAPTKEAIRAYFSAPERADFIKEKIAQGFTKLQITPFGTSLIYIEQIFNDVLQRQYEQGELYVDHHPIRFTEDGPPSVWTEPDLSNADVTRNIFYYPELADTSSHEVQEARAKFEILQDTAQPFPGFNVLLLQKERALQPEGYGVETRKRPPLPVGKSPIEYLKMLQDKNSPYFGETGLTLEDSFTQFILEVHRWHEIMDTHINAAGNDDGVRNLCIASFETIRVDDASPINYGGVPLICWDHVNKVINVDEISTKLSNERWGLRTGVK